MQMYNIHESIIVMKCSDTRFFRCFCFARVFVLHVFYPVKSLSAAPPGLNRCQTAILQFILYVCNRFVNGMVYYGVSFSSPSVGGNMYLNFFITSTIALVAYPALAWGCNRYTCMLLA